MCIKWFEIWSRQLYYVSDHFKTVEICKRAVESNPSSFHFVPDMFVTQEQIYLWHDEYGNNDDIIKWNEGYKKPKNQKAKIKEELMPIA